MKKILSILVLAVVTIVSVTSCGKNDFNVNQNPNSPTDSTVSYNVILPAALNNTARIVSRQWGFTLQSWLGYWARSGTFAPNVDLESYQALPNNGNFSGPWTALYDNLYDYQTMQIGATRAGGTFYSGIARIMKAHNFALLVDLYNNIPYSQALLGASNTTPKYDKGIDVYRDLLKQIDTGKSLIAAADPASATNLDIATNDIMFGGSQARWAQFANTLKLRLLVHLMNAGVATGSSTSVPGIDINTELAGMTGGFLTADAEVNPGYTTDKPNPFYNLYVANIDGTATQNSVYFKANSYAVGDDTKGGYYQYNGDPRIDRFYRAPGANHRGVDYGLSPVTSNAAATLSSIGPGVIRGVDKPIWILTAAESFMLQAEALQRGFALMGATGTPATLLRDGIRASFVSLGLTSAQADAYITGNTGYVDVDINGTILFGGIQPGVYTIISQKWFALNGIAPFEVYSDYRRVDLNASTDHFVYGVGSGFRAGPPISVYTFNTATEIPSRFPYPQSEYDYNSANVGAEGTINPFTSKIFWDLN